MNTSLLCVSLAATLTLAPSVQAQSALMAAQKTLQKEQFYFGKPNGKMDEESRAALRRFQIHHGLPVTGEFDATTSEALKNVDGSKKSGAENPARQSSSVRDLARDVVKSDREFLDRIEPANRSSARPAVSAPSSEKERPDAAASPRLKESTTRLAAADAHAVSAAEAQDFVRHYLDAAEGPTPDGEVAHYADRVDYFDSGMVSRAFIAKDQRNYYNRWPSRDFGLLEPPEVLASAGQTATVRFRLRYNLRSGRDSVEGRVENVVRVEKKADGLKIVRIRERKL